MNIFFSKITVAKRKGSGGFTLIEILVVMAIIGVLLSIAIPAILGVLNTAKRAKDKTNAVNVKTAVTSYVTDNGVLPAPNPTANADTTYGPAEGAVTTAAGSNTNLFYWGLCGNVNPYNAAVEPYTTTMINPRGVQYLTLQKSMVDNNGVLVQAFMAGANNQYFTVFLDTNYDNTLAGCPNPLNGTSGNTATETVNDNCAVWCNNDQTYTTPNTRWSTTY